MAGAKGFEPLNAGTKNQCLTAWRRPIEKLVYYNSICSITFVKLEFNITPIHLCLFTQYFSSKALKDRHYSLRYKA